MDSVDEIIDAWVRTVRSGRVKHHCGSAEHMFRAAELDILNELQPYPELAVPVNVRLGWACELAWRQLHPVNLRLLLSHHYIKNRSLAEAARRAKIPRHKAEFLLQRARQEIKMKLMTRGMT